jgi:hypothetical protein
VSHVTAVGVTIDDSDLAALKDACAELGLEFRANQKTFNWYGRWVDDYHGADAAYQQGIDPKTYGTCEHAIGVPGSSAYEVGLVRGPDGKFRVVFDNWADGYGLCKKIGAHGEKLLQSFGKHKLLAAARAEGLQIESIETTESGQLKVVLGHGVQPGGPDKPATGGTGQWHSQFGG